MSGVRTQPEVQAALAAGRPVVALETAVLTHGLPREPLGRSPRGIEDWNAESPINLEASRAMERAVCGAGAVPATVAVMRGALQIGLADEELSQLARDDRAEKAAARDLSLAMTGGRSAGTTVSATLHACALASPQPIRVMATGGIGGVHRDWTKRPDISADLAALAQSPVCVVCSGPKSVLDVPATLEALDTLGIPVIGWRTDRLPQFIAGLTDLPVTRRIDDAGELAEICAARWGRLRQRGALLVVHPVPRDLGLPPAEVDQATQQAEAEADTAGIRGPQRTPFALSALARLTNGRSLEANLALLASNAALAGVLAGAVAAVKIDPSGGEYA